MTELRAHHGRGAFRLGLKLRKAACGSRQLLCLGYFAWGCFRYFGSGCLKRDEFRWNRLSPVLVHLSPPGRGRIAKQSG